MAKRKTFSVGVIVKGWLDVDVRAASLEEALELSKQLTIDDCLYVQSGAGWNDYNMRVIQVFDPDFSTEVDT